MCLTSEIIRYSAICLFGVCIISILHFHFPFCFFYDSAAVLVLQSSFCLFHSHSMLADCISFVLLFHSCHVSIILLLCGGQCGSFKTLLLCI